MSLDAFHDAAGRSIAWELQHVTFASRDAAELAALYHKVMQPRSGLDSEAAQGVQEKEEPASSDGLTNSSDQGGCRMKKQVSVHKLAVRGDVRSALWNPHSSGLWTLHTLRSLGRHS